MRGLWFEEAFTVDGGVRAPYAALRDRLGMDPLNPSSSIAEQLRDRPLGDDVRIFPVPLVIDDDEYRLVIQAGVAQRALVLQQLFADLIFETQHVLTAGVGLDRGLIDEIFATEGTTLARLRQFWRGHQIEEIRFVYGPDLVRESTGQWVVLEDNVGCIGGSADSYFVTDRYREAMNLPTCGVCRPRPDLAVAVRQWLHRIGRDPDHGVVAVLGCGDAVGGGPWGLRIDENVRRHLILDELGIPVVARGVGTPTTIVNFDVDESWASEFHSPGMAMMNAPGTGVLGNKALLPFIDDLVRFYTREEPILHTPCTLLLRGGSIPADKENWVVKTSTGCQGSEVFVLDWQTPHRLELVEDRARSEWSGAAAVAQRYVELSRLTPSGPGGWDAYRVEIRPVAYVLDPHEVYVSEQSVGKVVSIYDPRRLNNISQGACYAPVLRQPCHECGQAN